MASTKKDSDNGKEKAVADGMAMIGSQVPVMDGRQSGEVGIQSCQDTAHAGENTAHFGQFFNHSGQDIAHSGEFDNHSGQDSTQLSQVNAQSDQDSVQTIQVGIDSGEADVESDEDTAQSSQVATVSQKIQPPLLNLTGRDLEEFTCFRELPTEMRLLIWRTTFVPRIVYLELVPWQNIPWKTVPVDLCRSSAEIPVALRICKESRHEAKKHYFLSFGLSAFLPSEAAYPKRTRPGHVYFNFSIDTLFIAKPLDILISYLDRFDESERNKIRYLAVEWADLQTPDLARYYFHFFPNLKDVFEIRRLSFASFVEPFYLNELCTRFQLQFADGPPRPGVSPARTVTAADQGLVISRINVSAQPPMFFTFVSHSPLTIRIPWSRLQMLGVPMLPELIQSVPEEKLALVSIKNARFPDLVDPEHRFDDASVLWLKYGRTE